MSFYKSLKQLWLKIEHKNIIVCSGNIDEIIYDKSDDYKEVSPLTIEFAIGDFISVTEHLCMQAKKLNYSSIKYFSPNLGIINYLEPSQNKNNTNPNNDEFSDFPSNGNPTNLGDFIEEINSEFESIRENNEKIYKNIYIIECGNVLLDKSANNQSIQIAKLIDSFVQFTKQKPDFFHRNKIKLIILTRSAEMINHYISTNNNEFSSFTLQIPNKIERENFYNRFKPRFSCLSESCKEPTNLDYKDLITLTEGMSFREVFQYAKIDPSHNPELIDIKFSELYKLVNFHKKESEWEKIDFSKMESIQEFLEKRVKGQEYALNIAKKTLIRSFTGMNGVLHSTNNNRKPKGVLFLVGPTGTGKTELAKSISEFVFGDEKRIIRFDMSEYNHEHSDQRLIGAPPGYVGYDAGGELTNAVKQKPFSILLFDEIEKAHGKILDKFLQILEDGRLTSSQGEVIDFSETFIIFTSNIGSKKFTGNIKNEIEVREHYIKEVTNHFFNVLNRPEILNRIGMKNIIPFNYIVDNSIIEKIITTKINKFQKMMEIDRLIQIKFINNSLNKIIEIVINNYDNSMGGRGVISELETTFIDELSMFLFQSNSQILQNKKDQKYTIIEVSYSDYLKFNIV